MRVIIKKIDKYELKRILFPIYKLKKKEEYNFKKNLFCKQYMKYFMQYKNLIKFKVILLKYLYLIMLTCTQHT